MSAASSGNPAGIPSTIATSSGPCDSPAVDQRSRVMLKSYLVWPRKTAPMSPMGWTGRSVEAPVLPRIALGWPAPDDDERTAAQRPLAGAGDERARWRRSLLGACP